MIYHGISSNQQYRIGTTLLNFHDPSKVTGRLPQPSLEPEEDYEKVGDVPNVVFPEEAAVLNNKLFVHYCASDKACCVATGNLNLF